MQAYSGSLTLWDYAVFLVYIGLSVGLGLRAGGRQKDLKTYLLAGHQMHWAMIGISVLAALFSGISFLGAPAETFGHNLVYLWVVAAFFIATPVATLIFLPFFFRCNFYTAYEYLEHRFNLKIRRLSSASFLFRGTLWLSLALYAPSLVVSEMIGIPLWVSIVLTSLAALVYTTVGGMRAVIYTDVMQFGVLLFGIVVVLIAALGKIPGGLEGAWRIAEAGGRTTLADWSFSLEERMTLWGALLGGSVINLAGLITDQVSVQRYLTASSLDECKRALWLKLFLSLPLVGIFYFTGLILYAFYQSNPGMLESLSNVDRLLPHFVSRQLSAPVPGLLVAAILAATMSTISAGINSLTTATMMDFLYARERQRADPAVEASRVRAARWWTVAYGAVITLLALVVGRLGSLVEASNKIAGCFGGPLLGIFFLGVFSRRANAPGSLIGVTFGFLCVVGTGFFTPVSFMWYAVIGLLATYGAGETASLFFEPPNETQKGFTLKRPHEQVARSSPGNEGEPSLLLQNENKHHED